MLTGVRFGETIGSPVAIEIANTEWPKWTEVMSADPLDHDIPREGRNAPLSRPRPGHADLTGMRKYGFDDARPVLERSSARETASRVALGEVAKQFLEQTLGIRTVSHVLSIGGAGITDPQNAVLPKPEDLEALDASPVRTLDKTAEQQMIARIDEAKENADTLGGVIEVVVYGVPAGIGTYVESDRRLDAALASAVMGVQAIKGVEIGDGFLEADHPACRVRRRHPLPDPRIQLGVEPVDRTETAIHRLLLIRADGHLSDRALHVAGQSHVSDRPAQHRADRFLRCVRRGLPVFHRFQRRRHRGAGRAAMAVRRVLLRRHRQSFLQSAVA